MKKTNNGITSKIPETPQDIGKHIFTFLHLEEANIFQLLYVDVDLKGVNAFQLYGRFNGETVTPIQGDAFFLLNTVDFKLVNMNSNVQEVFKIDDAELKTSDKNPNAIDLFLTIAQVHQKNEGVDFTLHTDFQIQKNQFIDCHAAFGNVPSNRNGRPCNLKAYF